MGCTSQLEETRAGPRGAPSRAEKDGVGSGDSPLFPDEELEAQRGDRFAQGHAGQKAAWRVALVTPGNWLHPGVVSIHSRVALCAQEESEEGLGSAC